MSDIDRLIQHEYVEGNRFLAIDAKNELVSMRAKLAAADKLAEAIESLDGTKINIALDEYRKAGTNDQR